SAKMWPSFSLCAWRILKIRSCLRRPLAPGKSSERAMRVSSVMFFSFSSAMVMVTYRRLIQKGGLLGKTVVQPAGGGQVSNLGSPPLRLSYVFRLGHYFLPLRACNPFQDLVHGLLDTCIRLVKTPSCLGCKLTEHIPVSQRM